MNATASSDDETLSRVADVMTPTETALVPDASVSAAVRMLKAERLAAIPVVAAGRVAGIVTAAHLLGEPPYRPVRDVMHSPVTPASPDLTLLQAHALVSNQGLDVVPVLAAGRVVGQVSRAAVVAGMGQQTDPLTGLPWSSALRTWAAMWIGRRLEVAVLFIDLDNFREVNKALGHVVGDAILKTMADRLARCADPASDLLCRYGGDEFAIATIRRAEEARTLGERIRTEVAVPVHVEGAARRVTVSVGFAGGRRADGRASAHAPATIEDLLVLASRASTDAKAAEDAAGREARSAGMPGPVRGARLRLVEVRTEGPAARTTAVVRLRLGSREVVGTVTGAGRGRSGLFLVAEATLEAVGRALGERLTFVIEDLRHTSTAAYHLAVVILVGGARKACRLVGGALAAGRADAACRAVLDALNRPLEEALAERLRRDSTPP